MNILDKDEYQCKSGQKTNKLEQIKLKFPSAHNIEERIRNSKTSSLEKELEDILAQLDKATDYTIEVTIISDTAWKFLKKLGYKIKHEQTGNNEYAHKISCR